MAFETRVADTKAAISAAHPELELRFELVKIRSEPTPALTLGPYCETKPAPRLAAVHAYDKSGRRIDARPVEG